MIQDQKVQDLEYKKILTGDTVHFLKRSTGAIRTFLRLNGSFNHKNKGFNRKTDDRIPKPPVSLQNKTITRVSGIDELDFKSQQ